MDRVSDHLGGWASYQTHQQGLSPGTIRLRRYELGSWSQWIGGRWGEATFEDVEAWVGSRPLAAKARQSAVSHVRMFYRWARREHLTTVDPCADVISPKVPRRLPRPTPAAVVSAAVGLGESRAELACALMAYGGLRCCEVAVLRWEDVGSERLFVPRSKGGDQRSVRIAPPLAPILAAGDGRIGPVIASTIDGGPLSAHRVGVLVRAHLRRLGSVCTAHQFRHYAATHVGERAGGDLRVVRDFLGHRRISTTEIYAELLPGAVDDAVARW
jgi:integrase/recombinase XerC